MFRKRQVPEVVRNKDFLELTKFIRELVIIAKNPVFSIMPPKLIAQIINQIVLSIPDIPDVEIKSLTAKLFVSNLHQLSWLL